MKLFIWIMAAIAGYFYLFGGTDNDIVIPRKTTSERSGTGIKTHEFMALFEAKQPFSGLARSDYYTIVEVYLDSCTVCKRLEKGYAPFLDKRKDVLIHKVHFPESGINLSFNEGSEEEMRKQMEETQLLIDSYKVCGISHIEIYAPDQNLLSADDCAKKQGTRFLRQWISTETGIPALTLQISTRIFPHSRLH